jgi:glyoxylase-like metal-dependent hydrolase (beta-lactamase superfamily II)
VLRERVSESIYVFTSDLYAQVTAGVIVTEQGAIIVDTLPFPAESRELARFVSRVARGGTKYVILTHYHADHVYGATFLPDARIVAHMRCRDLLNDLGQPALEAAKAQEPELEDVVIRLPDVSFEKGVMGLQLGGRTVQLIHAPGHTPDGIMVYVEDDRVLFASDVVMPVPSIADGDVDVFRESLRKVPELPIENLIQGHGEVILRGEVGDVVETNLRYLDTIEEKTRKVIKSGGGRSELLEIGIEACGLSRIPLNGLVQQIHQANLLSMYDWISSKKR